MRTPLLAAAAASSAITAAGAVAYVAGPWYHRWGRADDEGASTLPGDEIVAEPTATETRSIAIAASPEDVWPWLVQMGYGRAGWYSYDGLDADRPSATRIVPDLQSIAVGDLLPTHPGGGFVVRTVRPNDALVVSVDGDTVRAQANAAGAEGLATATAGVRMSGRILSTQPTRFVASWAFVLRPAGVGSTRLTERFRVRYEHAGPGQRLVGPFLGFGVFLMMRRQLLGIRSRAEARVASRADWWTAAGRPEDTSRSALGADDPVAGRDGDPDVAAERPSATRAADEAAQSVASA